MSALGVRAKVESVASQRDTWIALGAAASVYVAALAALVRMPDSAGWADPLFLLGSLVVVFPALAWTLTREQAARRERAPATSALQLAGLFVFLAVFAAAILGYGFCAINAGFPEEHTQAFVKLAVKLVTMVILPWTLFASASPRTPAVGTAIRSNFFALAVLGVAFTVFQCVAGHGMQNLAELHPTHLTLLWAIPACLIWQTVEAGLCEEVLFRRVLQERLAGFARSPAVAVVWSSLLFGLAHAPGLYLRGGSLLEGVAAPTPLWAAAYSIVMIAPAGVLFGVVWARTRSLWLVVALHGIVDLVPQLAPFIQTWRH
jgi:membrane protease YdiL (CAAX protease family)